MFAFSHRLTVIRRILPLTSLFLSACMVGPDYHRPALHIPKAWNGQSASLKFAQTNVSEWWKDFHDETLNKLVCKTLQENQDRKVARARILEARGQRMNVAALLYPQVSANGEARRGNPGYFTNNKTINLFQGSFDASWEIDLFGGRRRNVEASNAQIASTIASYHNITISLVAEVVSEYTRYREFQRRYVVTQKIADSQKQLAKLTRKKYEQGAASGLDTDQAEALYRTTLANLPELARQATAAMYRISVLTGAQNDEVLTMISKPGRIPFVTLAPVMKEPASTLCHRPDIAEAERNLAARTALTGVAISELYPKITLSSLLGGQDTSILPSTRIWNITSGITTPILNFGRIKGQIRAADARQLQAFHTYKQTVIAAIGDVETRLSDYQKNKQHAEALKLALNSNLRALSAAQKRYDNGFTPLLDVLVAQNQVYDVENAYVSALASEAISVAALQKAGGN